MLDRLKKKVVPALPGSVEEATQGSRGYPEESYVGSLRERRLLIALRSVSFALIMALFGVIIEGFLLVSLMPLKEVRPFIVQAVAEGDLLASVKPIPDVFEAKDILTEKLIREYVVKRQEILRSNAIMSSRWSQGGFMGIATDQDEYRRFRTQVLESLETARQEDAEIRVRILSVAAITLGQTYVVDFESTLYDGNNNVVETSVWTASLEIEFRKLSNLTTEQMLINPTGFTVVHYSVAEKAQ